MNKDLENAVVNLGQSMNNTFLDEDDRVPVDKLELNDGNLVFTAELLAMAMQFRQLTGDKCDLLEFIGILNKLAFQYLQESSDKP